MCRMKDVNVQSKFGDSRERLKQGRQEAGGMDSAVGITTAKYTAAVVARDEHLQQPL